MLKLGYKASAEQFAPGPLLDFSVLAEQVGFDSVFISDHFQPWKHTDGHAPYSLVWLGALGARTQRVVMGTSVLTPTFRYHPSIVAQAFGTLGAMFPGRVILGIGTGEGLNEVPSTGQPWPEFKERFARMREAVTLIRKLWTEERVSFEGQYYKTEKATIYDRPGRAGADLRRRRRRAGREICRPRRRRLHLHQRQEAGALHRDAAAQRRRRASRPRRRRSRSLRPHDRGEGLVRHRQGSARWRIPATGRRWRSRAEEKMSVEDPVEMERLADALPLERAASRWIVSNDPEEQVEQIGYYVEPRLQPSGVPRARGRTRRAS